MNFMIFKEFKGFSIVEVTLATALIVLAISALGAYYAASAAISAQIIDGESARLLSGESLEAVRTIKNENSVPFEFERSAAIYENGSWILSGEGTEEQIGKFTRTVDFLPVWRLADGNLASENDPEAVEDDLSKIVKVGIAWKDFYNRDRLVSRETMMTLWQEARAEEATTTATTTTP
jgi:hypothetical protein